MRPVALLRSDEGASERPRLVPIARTTLHAELVTRIRDLIIDGTLPTGGRVHEGQLGAALGISRTPLREALKFLASEGLIELVPGRGAVVRQLTVRDVQDMLAVLSTLEQMAARLACEHASADQIAAIRADHDAMMLFVESGNRLDYYKRNQAIHSGIAAASGNAFLAETHEGIQSRLRRIRYTGNEAPPKWRAAIAEHVEMIDALEQRDADALAEIVARHLRLTWDRVRDSI